MTANTAFGNVPVGARYYCAACERNTEIPSEHADVRVPICVFCGGEVTYNGPILPEPIASQGWNSFSIAEYWRGAKRPAYDTQLDFFDL